MGPVSPAGCARCGTILDAHLVQLIICGIMIWLGTGPIKGFGVTLLIGVLSTLFSVLITGHLLMELLVDSGLTPLQAITAATGASARAVKVANLRGTIAPGMAAERVEGEFVSSAYFPALGVSAPVVWN